MQGSILGRTITLVHHRMLKLSSRRTIFHVPHCLTIKELCFDILYQFSNAILHAQRYLNIPKLNSYTVKEKLEAKDVKHAPMNVHLLFHIFTTVI